MPRLRRAAVSCLAGASFLTFGLHRSIWSYTSISDLSAIAKASTWAILVFVVLGTAVDRMTEVPRAVWVNQWLILIVLLCGTRLAIPVRQVHGPARGRVPCAPETARRARAAVWLRPMASCSWARSVDAGDQHAGVGILDDSGIPRGRYVHDVPVLGAKDLDRIVAELAVQGIQPRRLVMTRPADAWPRVRTCRALPRPYGLEYTFCPTCWACRPARWRVPPRKPRARASVPTSASAAPSR